MFKFQQKSIERQIKRWLLIIKNNPFHYNQARRD